MILYIIDIIESISSFLEYKDLISLNCVNSNIKLDIDTLMINQKNLNYIKLSLTKNRFNLLDKCNDIKFTKDFLNLFIISNRNNLFKKTFNENIFQININNIKKYCVNSILYSNFSSFREGSNFNIYFFIINQFNDKFNNQFNNDVKININNEIINTLITNNNYQLLDKFFYYINNNAIININNNKIDIINICINNEYEECLDILIKYNYILIENKHLCNAILNSNISIIKKILLYTNPTENNFKALKINDNHEIAKILWKDKRIKKYIKNGEEDILKYFKFYPSRKADKF